MVDLLRGGQCRESALSCWPVQATPESGRHSLSAALVVSNSCRSQFLSDARTAAARAGSTMQPSFRACCNPQCFQTELSFMRKCLGSYTLKCSHCLSSRRKTISKINCCDHTMSLLNSGTSCLVTGLSMTIVISNVVRTCLERSCISMLICKLWTDRTYSCLVDAGWLRGII